MRLGAKTVAGEVCLENQQSRTFFILPFRFGVNFQKFMRNKTQKAFSPIIRVNQIFTLSFAQNCKLERSSYLAEC